MIEIWVQAGAAVPGTDERAVPTSPPAMGSGDAAFVSFNEDFTGSGVLLADHHGIRELVGGRFRGPVTELSYDGDWISFTAFGDRPGCEDCQALYRWADGTLTEIFAAGDALPDDPDRTVFSIGGISTDGGQIVFAATRSPSSVGEPVLVRFTEAAGLEVVVDAETPVPGEGSATFIRITDPRVSEGTIFFRGFYDGKEGIFALRDGEVLRIAATGDPVPEGPPGQVFAQFPQQSRLTASDGAVAFVAKSELGLSGLYWTVGGTLERALPFGVPVPGLGGAIFTGFGQPALAGDELVFEAPGFAGADGRDLYLLHDGRVSRLVTGGCSVHLIGPESFRDARVGFARTDERPERLRVAHLEVPPPAGETYLGEDSPDFRFTVRISADGRTIPTREEPECLADTLCVGGALPGRAEVSLRILGPRPNGRLWPVISRLSPSRIEVWIEQLSTGLLRYYLLDDLPPGTQELAGVVDRRGFPAQP